MLVAALHPPGDRTVCLSKFDEDVFVGSDVFRLGANEFAETIYPQGYMLLDAFSVSPLPTWIYRAGGVELHKTVFMPNGKNAVSAIYNVANRTGGEAKLRIYPMLTCRHFHSVINRAANPLEFNQKKRRRRV